MRSLARLLVGLRFAIPLAWIAAAALATVALPPLGATGSAPLDDLVAEDGGAATQQREATERFGFPLYTDTLVVGGVQPGTRERHLQAARAVRERRTPDLPNLRAVLPIADDTTVIDYLFFSDEANLDERAAIAHRYAAKYLGGGKVTGAAPARLAQYSEIQGALPLVEAASVALILLVVGLAFRSIGAPLVALFTAGIAYLIAVRVLPWLGQRSGATVPAEVEPIIVVLLLGLVTDYTVFFLSETRRRLQRGEDPREAVRAATRRTLPIVLTAGLIVAAGTGALAVGELGFFRAFGPGLAATTLVALAVSATLVPALLALFGARLYGRHLKPHGSDGPVPQRTTDTWDIERSRRAVHLEHPGPRSRLRMALTRPILSLRRTGRLAELAQTTRWRVTIARIASARPVALVIAVTCLAGLGVLAMGTNDTRLGLGFVSALPAGNEVRQAADEAARGFAPGIVSPVEIDITPPADRAALSRFEALVEREPGVASVIGPREQLDGAPEVLLNERGARLAVILDSDPLAAPAIDRLHALRDRIPRLLEQSGIDGATFAVGGETAVAGETVDAVLADLKRIGIVALAVNFLLLALFLRALIAPLYLVAVSVLGLAASLGLTTFVFQTVLGYDDLTYYVPFGAAVLLVALGSDYNVFVAGRIWEEARWMRLREAIAVATPAAAKAVTVAGVALAASFALLAVVPLRSFREFAFVMAVGVLLDTFVVRSLLVPALTSLFGEAAWWPGRRLEPLSADAIVERVGNRTHLRDEEARALIEGTLSALGDRITARERRVLEKQFPFPVESASDGERFGVEEFLARARERAGGRAVSDDAMRDYVAAVLRTLAEASPDDLAYVRAQLSEDYDPLFGAPRGRFQRGGSTPVSGLSPV